MDTPELVLHVWPGRWGLPSIFPDCLAVIIYAQLTISGKFVVEECTNPDLSPDGQLPYLTHGQACIASLSSITKYIARLHRRSSEDDEEVRVEDLTDLSASLTRAERAKETAWISFVASHLGDLVACSFFTLRHNYREFMRRELADNLPLPQKYYLPDRLRESHKYRLDVVGLWTVHAEEVEEERRKRIGVTTRAELSDAFGKEKVLEKANATLRLLAGLLGDKPFFFGDNPTTLDIVVASHILLLTLPPLPNDLLRNLVTNSYSSLHLHARKLLARALPPNPSTALHTSLSSSLSSSFDFAEAESRHLIAVVPLRVRSPATSTFADLTRSFAIPSLSRSSVESQHKSDEGSSEDRKFALIRWAWFATALGGLMWAASGFQIVVIAEDEETDHLPMSGEAREPQPEEEVDVEIQVEESDEDNDGAEEVEEEEEEHD